MFRHIPLNEAQTAILRGGHALKKTLPGKRPSLDIASDPETVVTIASDYDPTVKPAYRDRFFLCRATTRRFFSRHWAGVPVMNAWRAKLKPIGANGWWKRFLTGPATWLLHRLCLQRTIPVWSGDDSKWYPELAAEFKALTGISQNAEPIVRALAESANRGPFCLLPENEDCAALFAMITTVSVLSDNDAYIATHDFSEVYKIHHHAKIVCSIPNARSRLDVVEDLLTHPGLYLDVSGYI